MAGLTYAFNPAAGESPEALARRRAVAEAMLANALSRAPQNIGEGLYALGAGIGARLEKNRIAKAEAAGRASGDSAFAGIFGGGGGPASPDMAGLVPGMGGAGGMKAYQDAIAEIESGGRYDAVGPTHSKLGRALGKYQIMEANIGPWSREVLGREVSPREFMANPQIQDAIFNGKFGQYVQKYGPEGAARAWIGGPGAINKTDRKDSLGTSVGAYGQRFMKNLGATGGQQAVAEALVGGGGQATMVGGSGNDMITVAPAEPATDDAAKDDFYVPVPSAAPPVPVAVPDPRMRPEMAAEPQISGGGGSDTILGGRRALGFDPFTSRGPAFDRVANTGHDSLAPGTGRAAVADALMGGGAAQPLHPVAPVTVPPATQPAVGGVPVTAPAQVPTQTVAPAGAAPAPQQGQPQASRIDQLMQAAANPWLNPQQRAVVETMLKQEIEMADPRTRLEIEKTMADIDKAKRPDTSTVGNRVVDTTTGQVIYEGPQSPTTDIQEYEYAKQQGYGGTFDQYQMDKRRAGASSVTVGGETMTPGQKKVDEAFADDYLEWTARGGFADVDKQLTQLDQAAQQLATEDGLTGPAVGATPDWALAWANPKAIRTREAVQEVVQRNLRLVLGSQFTEKEGERLIARAYNPSLPQEENALRVRRLMDSIRNAAEARQSAADYFAERGTLMGWSGKLPSFSDIESSITGDTSVPASQNTGGILPNIPADMQPGQTMQLPDGSTVRRIN